MVRWYHAIFSAYGFWLPNDPRGSWSDFIGAYELYRRGGAATTVAGKRSYAHDPHDRSRRLASKQVLKHPPVRFTANQRDCIAAGIKQACAESEIALLALALSADHGHAVVGRHVKRIERIVGQFKGRASQHLLTHGLHPFIDERGLPTRSPFSDNCWSVFISDEDQLRAAIGYIERHPIKEGLPPQNYSFVQRFV